MASKLTLRFADVGIVNATVTIATGKTYTFKEQRLGFRQVSVGNNPKVKPEQLAQLFRDAFNADDNFTNEVKITYSATALDENGIEQTPTGTLDGILVFEHFDNTYFDGFVETTSFLIGTVETTTQQEAANLTVGLTQSPTDTCGKFNLNIQSNVKSGRLTIEIPTGNVIVDVPTDISGAFVYDLDRIRPNLATGGVVKIYETEFAGEELKKVFFTAPGVLSVTSVSVEGTPFGASATINAVGTNLEYSLDNVSFQGSKQYAGLLEGNYTAYVKDPYGCVKSKTFVITADQVNGLTSPPYINVPIHNSIRFANRTQENFLSYLSTETPNYVKIREYAQDYLQSDVVRTQFKSSYTDNKAYLIDSAGTETEIAIIKKSNNISRLNIYQGNYTAYDGRLAVYFDAGIIYNSNGTVQEIGHTLNGNLPGWYEEGMYLNIEGVGVTQIDRIVFDEALEVVYAVTQLNGLGTVLNKKITSIHTAHPYEVFEFDISFNIPEGKYQIRVNYGDDFYLSEIIKVSTELDENYLTVQWYNDKNNDILYNTGIKQLRRIPWENYFTLIPEAEIETYDTDTSVEKINSKTFANYSLEFDKMPMEVARGLQTGLDNSSNVIINGAMFVTKKGVELDPAGQWYFPKTELTLTEQVMDGQQTILDAVIPSFLIVTQDPNGVGFLRL